MPPFSAILQLFESRITRINYKKFVKGVEFGDEGCLFVCFVCPLLSRVKVTMKVKLGGFLV